MADLSAVLDVLRQRPAADLQAWGCAALRNLTEEGGQDFRLRALEEGALQLVITALQRHEAVAQVQECGLAALSGFAKALSGVEAKSGLRLALKAIKEHYAQEEVCRWALSALSELLRVENTAEELGKYSFLDVVSFAMQRHPAAAQVQACGCAFLSRLALKSDETTVAALDKATRGIVFNAMEAHEAVEVQACGSSALGAFVLRGGHQKTMVESRAPHLLLEAMRRHPSNATVQEKAANALRLVVGSDGRAKALKLGAPQVLVAALQRHLDASGVLSACLTTLQCLVHVAPAVLGYGFALLPPETPRECPTQLLQQILQRYPENNSILDPALSLLWGSMGQDPTVSSCSTAVAMAALDVVPAPATPRAVASAAAVLTMALAAPVPGSAGKQLLRVIKLHPQNRMLQERAWEALLQVLRLSCDPATETTLDMASMLRNLVESMKRHAGPVQRIGCDIMTLCCLPDFCREATSHREQLLGLEAPLVVAEAMRKNLQVAEMQDSACASLQCLAAQQCGALVGVEDALLAALQAQQAPEVQIRALDLLSALAPLASVSRAALLEALPLALRALRRYGMESSSLAEVAVRFLLRMVDSEGEDTQEPMEGIAGLVLDFLDEKQPSLATRSFLRFLARRCHDVATRILAAQGLQPAAEAIAPPLLTLQLLHGLALRGRAARQALRGCEEAKRKALEALRLQEEDAPEPETLRACACALWSRLCADGPAAVQQLMDNGSGQGDAEGEAVPELLELLMEQVEVSGLAMRSWGFLTLQNFLCGTSATFATLRHRLLHRGLLRCLAVAAAEQSLASSLNTTQSMAQQQQGARMKLETILMICLHTIGSSCDPNDEDLLSDEVLSMLIRGLSSSWALEVRERACFLLCYLANCNQKVKDTLLEGGSSLWKTMLEVLKDHLAAEDGEASEAPGEAEEILLELSLPDSESDTADAELAAPLRALQLRRAELLLEAMQALSFEARVQVIACTDLRRLALLSMSAMAGARGNADPQCRALVQRLPRGLGNSVQAMRQHERSDEVQRAAVLSLQALTRLCCSLEGEDVAIQRVVEMEAVPILARALRNYPEDPQLQERGLDVLRLLSTRREAVTQQLCELEVVPAVVEAMNLNISKSKIQEYGLSLLAEVGWQGPEQQRVCLAQLAVEAVVRALKAFPASAEVQTNGLAAVQALTSDNEECRVKFFSLCEILEMVLQAMGNFPLQEGVQAFGCCALISLAHSKSERIGALADLNCASMAESAMVGHPKSQRVVEFAEHLMQILKKG